MKEHFRGLVWPRDPKQGPEGKVYRYLVVGLLVTDTPIDGLEGHNETLLDSHSPGLSMVLKALPKYDNKGMPIGEVGNFVVSLSDFNDYYKPTLR